MVTSLRQVLMPAILLLLMLGGIGANAQTPPFYNIASGTSTNAFPMSSAGGKGIQWIVNPGEFTLPTSPAAGQAITTVWFYAASAINATYSDFYIKMGQISSNTDPAWTSTTMYTGPMTQVVNPSTRTITSAGASWYSITLDVPFLFDPAQALIVEVGQCGFSGSSSQAVSTFSASGIRRKYLNPTVSCGQSYAGQDGNMSPIGVTLQPQGPPCTGTPTAGTASGPSGVCSGGQLQLSVTGYTAAPGISFQWESSPAGMFAFQPVTGATSPSLNTTQSIATDYRVIVTCSNGGGSQTSNVVTVNMNPFYLCYCSPLTGTSIHGSTTANYITSVTIQGTTLNSSSTLVGPGGHSLFDPSVPTNTATLMQTATYTLDATIANSGYITEAWFDWDQSGTFDATEHYTLTPGLTSTLSFQVPGTAVPGSTGMRLRNATSTAHGAAGACSVVTQGRETEDYVINIAPATPCVGTPTAGTAASPITSACANAPISLTLSGYTVATGISIDWQSSPAGTNSWTPVAGGTTALLNTTMPNGSTDFRAVVTCANGGGSQPSNIVTLTNNPFYFCYCSPITGTTLHSGSATNYVTNVTIPGTSLNHSTGAVTTDGYTFADPATPSNTASLPLGVPFTIDITHSSNSASINHEIWVDWDQNGTFDAGEYYTAINNGSSSSVTIAPPVTATLGMTGLRIRTVFSTTTNFGSGGACSAISVGRETQDYVITLTPAPSCLPPTGITAGPVASTTATITWTAIGSAPGVGYDYYYFTANTPPTSTTTPTGSVGPTVTTVNLTGLTPVTTYYVWVRSNCAANDQSTWSGPEVFTTACAPFTAPYTHDVESQVANTSSTMNGCWTSNPSAASVFAWHITGTGTTGSTNTGPSSAHSGSKYFFTEASNGTTNDVATLTTPLVDVTGLTIPVLEFWYHMYGATTNKMVIEAFDGTSWNPVDSLIGEQQTSENDPWLSRTVALTGYTGPIQARFIVTRGTSFTGDVSLDDISIMQAPSCLPPTGVTVSPVTSTGATVNWTASGTPPGVGYDYYYNTTNTAPTSTTTPTGSTGPTVTTANLTGLTPVTTYYLWVRTSCAANDQSTWAGPEIFTTACAPFTAPYTHDVESQVANTTSTMNGCWTSNPSAASVFAWHVTGTGTTGSSNTGPNTAHSGSKYFFTEASSGTTNDVATLTTPMVDVTGLTTPMLEFWYHMYGATINKMVVEVFDGTTWNPVDSIIGEQQTSETDPWLPRSIVLNGYTGLIQARFVVTRGTSFTGDVSLDDISIMQAPSCPAPSGLTSVTTTSSATLSWTEQGSATQWQVEYGAPGFTQGTGTSVFTSANPLLLSGLPGATQYGFYVRSICGPNDTSAWTGPTLFATIPPNDTCTNATDITDGLVHTGTTAGATETMTPCDATTTTANDVWYSFTTGSVGGTVTVTVITTGTMDVVIQGFSGTCGSLTGMVPTASTTLTGTCIDGPAAGTEFGDFTVAPNTTYYVRVYGFNSLQGTFTIQAVGTPLAIKLESIKAVNVGSRNRIDWSTVSEDAGDRFDLERSADGKNFTVLSTIDAKGLASSYSYWDEQPFTGVNYYRLKMADPRGITSYSQVVTATMNGTGAFAVEAFPNPVTDVLTVRVHGTSASDGSASLYDATGKLVRTVNLTNNEATINMTGLSSGIYLLNYSDSNHRKSMRITKQ